MARGVSIGVDGEGTVGRVRSLMELTAHPERGTLAPSPFHLESDSDCPTPS